MLLRTLTTYIKIYVKEHQNAVRLKQSALVEYYLESEHQILLNKASILVKTKAYFPRKYRES